MPLNWKSYSVKKLEFICSLDLAGNNNPDVPQDVIQQAQRKQIKAARKLARLYDYRDYRDSHRLHRRRSRRSLAHWENLKASLTPNEDKAKNYAKQAGFIEEDTECNPETPAPHVYRRRHTVRRKPDPNATPRVQPARPPRQSQPASEPPRQQTPSLLQRGYEGVKEKAKAHLTPARAQWLLGWFTSIRLFLVRASRFYSIFVHPFLKPWFAVLGLSYLAEIIVDTIDIGKAVFLTPLSRSEEQLTTSQRLWQRFKKSLFEEQRIYRIGNAAIWFAVNCACLYLTGGASAILNLAGFSFDVMWEGIRNGSPAFTAWTALREMKKELSDPLTSPLDKLVTRFIHSKSQKEFYTLARRTAYKVFFTAVILVGMALIYYAPPAGYGLIIGSAFALGGGSIFLGFGKRVWDIATTTGVSYAKSAWGKLTGLFKTPAPAPEKDNNSIKMQTFNKTFLPPTRPSVPHPPVSGSPTPAVRPGHRRTTEAPQLMSLERRRSIKRANTTTANLSQQFNSRDKGKVSKLGKFGTGIAKPVAKPASHRISFGKGNSRVLQGTPA